MFPKVSTSKIKGLSPSLIMNGKKDQNRDTFCHEQLLELYKYFEETRDEYNLWRFSTGVFYQSNLLEDKLQNINTFTAVEVGCGPGMKSFSWAKKFKKYYGIDLDKYSIKSCEDTKRKFGFTNCEFICDRADQFIYKFDEKIDLLILYAVLEHLTLDERRVVLELANHVYENNGAIFIDETPNRLSPTDYHSFKLDFIQQCPPEIIHEYALEFSDRKELTDKMKGTDGITQTFRGGVGVSYHEFELWWKKFNSAGLLFDGYNSVALNLDPLRS